MATEYISREAAIEAHCMNCKCIDQEDDKSACWCMEKYHISQVPAADVRPVVRGKWVLKERAHYFKCSICKEPIAYRFGYGGDRYYNYCPNCGADMREADDESDD